jgi:uncharacterized protein YidB (DUF937 family)
MGLLDILTGGTANPRGQQSGGMSPIAMAILALLAGRVFGGSGGGVPGGMGRGQGGPWDSQGQTNPPAGGGLGDLLGGLLGGALGGGTGGSGMGGSGMPGGMSGGSVLTGGLGDLIRQMERNGHGDAARSWVGRGQNQRVSPEELEQALGPDNVDSLAQQAGIDRIGLLSGLSEQLPDVVDQLTPDGRLPTDDEAQEML